MEIKTVLVKDLVLYGKNQKKHKLEQVENVAESIREFGWQQPIVIDKDNNIIIGHCRFEAAKKLNLKEVPCVINEELDQKQAEKLRLLDNKFNESKWDMSLLEITLDGLDFDACKIDWGIKEVEEEIEPEVPFSEVLGEESNYILLKFNTDVDWLQAQTLFDIHPVLRKSTRADGTINFKMGNIGVGRVLDGASALQKILEG